MPSKPASAAWRARAGEVLDHLADLVELEIGFGASMWLATSDADHTGSFDQVAVVDAAVVRELQERERAVRRGSAR